MLQRHARSAPQRRLPRAGTVQAFCECADHRPRSGGVRGASSLLHSLSMVSCRATTNTMFRVKRCIVLRGECHVDRSMPVPELAWNGRRVTLR